MVETEDPSASDEQRNREDLSAISSKCTDSANTESDFPPAWTIWTAASYAMVMLVIGLPLWWQTTTVQRVPLPYNDMFNLHENFKKDFSVNTKFMLLGFSLLNNKDLHEEFKNYHGSTVSFERRDVPTKDLDIIYKSKDLNEVDALLCQQYSSSSQPLFRVFYVGRADLFQQYGHRIIFGNCRLIYYVSNNSKVNPPLLRSAIEKLLDHSLISSSAPVTESDEFLQLPLSAGYDILLSLLIPEPETSDCSWKPEELVHKYIQPVLDKLTPFADISIRSQVLYYVQLNLRPRWNEALKINEVQHNQLPLVINPVESKLTSFVSQNPALNFLIYTSPCDQTPLQILNEDGTILETNSFLVPQWGGIMIQNAPCNNTQSSVSESCSLSSSTIASIILSQFRTLIGLPAMTDEEDILSFRKVAVRDWEVDMLVKKRLKDLVLTASNTLNSLGNLLDKITNIVVTQEVGLQVEKSVRCLKNATRLASIGQLFAAQREAIEAFTASEIAFHHPTNLAQLYFPDDQKYAIYIPLFLPVGIPVIFSLRNIIQGLIRIFRSKSCVS